MIALTLRGLADRKLRSALTAIAVLLGVAMIAGTYVLTDQIRSGFTELERSIYAGVDVQVLPEQSFTSQANAAKTVREDLVAEVGNVPGVAKAEGELWSAGGLVIDGEFKRSAGGGGTIISTSSSEPFNPASNVDGRMPERAPRGRPAARHRREAQPGARGPRRDSDSWRRRTSHHRRGLRPRFGQCRRHRRGVRSSGRDPALVRQGRRGDVRQRRGRRRSCPRRARPAHPRSPASRTGGTHRRRGRGRHGQRDQRPDRGVPDSRPAGLCRCRSARGRVHHLQHLHHHGRRAHARVRPAAHARGHARTDPRRRRARGAGDRPGRLSAGYRARSAVRHRPRLDVRDRGAGPPHRRPRAQPAHHPDVAPGRRRRDPGRGDRTGPTGDARTADSGPPGRRRTPRHSGTGGRRSSRLR